MARTTNSDLDELAAIINRVLDADEYFIQSAYGQPRLMRAGGSVEVSPRLSKGELAQWMRAFIAGITAGDQAARRGLADKAHRLYRDGLLPNKASIGTMQRWLEGA